MAYDVCPECTQPCNMKKRHLLKKIQDTRNIVHKSMMPQSPSKLAPWDLTQFSQSSAPSYFPESHWWSEISSLSKVILILGKARSCRAPNMGCRGLSHLGDLMFCQKNSAWDRCDAWMGMVLWCSCQSPAAHSCGLLNYLHSYCGGMFKLNAQFDADSLLYSLSHFECNATQYICSLKGTYLPHWLVQWSCHCSHMLIPVHSPGCQVTLMLSQPFSLY